jgi:hypothetical protein
MQRNAIVIMCLTILTGLVLLCGAAQGQNITLGSNDQAQGAAISFSNPGPSSYFRLTFVDPNVNRLRIVNDRNFIFFDGHPEMRNEIFLPVGSYTATVWSAYGTMLACAIIGGFFNEPSPMPAASAPSGSQQPKQRIDYGFAPASDISPDVQYLTPQYPDYYSNYYNNYYPPYYFNNYNRPPINQPIVQQRPSSVTDPAYVREHFPGYIPLK